jgi:hypothetical protein
MNGPCQPSGTLNISRIDGFGVGIDTSRHIRPMIADKLAPMVVEFSLN